MKQWFQGGNPNTLSSSQLCRLQLIHIFLYQEGNFQHHDRPKGLRDSSDNPRIHNNYPTLIVSDSLSLDESLGYPLKVSNPITFRV